MDTARIAELLQPFLASFQPSRQRREGRRALPSTSTPPEDLSFRAGFRPEESAVLSPSQLEYISTYIDLLLRWNARVNLTSVRQPEDIVTRHFGESFFLARHLFPATGHVGTAAPGCPAERSSAETGRVGTGAHTCPAERRSAETDGPVPAQSVIDVGSGAGFPGLPIRIWAPHVHLTLIESNQKKVAFLREVVRALTLTHVEVFPGRAADYPGRAEVVTLRAVERFDLILPAAARLLANSGRLALLIGDSQMPRVRALVPELSWSHPSELPLSANRILIIGSKEPH
jgi:16S rRNA (guanine527-N7)-methyltransferase